MGGEGHRHGHKSNFENRYYCLRKVKGEIQVQMKEAKIEKLQKLLRSDSEPITRNLKDNSTDMDNNLNERLPTIKCECGAEILLLPDLKAMNRAIKAHVAEHKKKEKNSGSNSSTSSNISQLLSQLTLIKISTQNDS